MVFRGQHRWNIPANIRNNGQDILQVEEFGYLGVALDAKLSLRFFSDQQKVKMSRAYYAFKQNITVLPSNCPLQVAEQFFQTMVLSVANYGAEFWGANQCADKFLHDFWKSFLELRHRTPSDALYWITDVYQSIFPELLCN